MIAVFPIVLMAACGGEGAEAEARASPPDPRLRLAADALEAALPDRAAAVYAAVSAAPGRFFELLDEATAEADAAGGLLALVDKSRPLEPGYEPDDLVSLNDYPLSVTRKDLRLRKAVMTAVSEMDAAAKADGVRLVFASTYRSYEYQDGLFKRYAAAYGEAEASRFSARPGTSQHQLGTAIDFDPIDEAFASTDAGRWMEANAGRFGFSLSFPRGMEAVTGYIWESWHFRYVTRAGAALEREFFGGVQQYMLEFLDAYSR